MLDSMSKMLDSLMKSVQFDNMSSGTCQRYRLHLFQMFSTSFAMMESKKKIHDIQCITYQKVNVKPIVYYVDSGVTRRQRALLRTSVRIEHRLFWSCVSCLKELK